jgi:hypothetical protein
MLGVAKGGKKTRGGGSGAKGGGSGGCSEGTNVAALQFGGQQWGSKITFGGGNLPFSRGRQCDKVVTWGVKGGNGGNMRKLWYISQVHYWM